MSHSSDVPRVVREDELEGEYKWAREYNYELVKQPQQQGVRSCVGCAWRSDMP
jgi:hypothetical protein